jgi:predicted dehydrogenase
MPNKINVAMLGCGFMGRAHSNAYLNVNRFFDLEFEPVRKVVTGQTETEVRPFAERWGWKEYATDWRKVIDRKDIDIIDICMPNNLHHEAALAAAAAGKIVTCEKPLAMNRLQAEEMVNAVTKSGKPNMVWYNYRGVPATALARQIVKEGRLGKIFHYRGFYLQDWTINPNVPSGGKTTWRLDVNVAGSGVTGDLLAHTLDLAQWINGPLDSLTAMTETFIKERPLAQDPSQRVTIGIDDAAAALARFQNGSLGIFESTRFACGRKSQNLLEIYGENGALAWDMETLHELLYYNHQDESIVRGWRTISVWDSDQPYMKHWWVPGCQIGYEHTFIHLLADFLDGLAKNEKKSPDFKDGLTTQIVCDTLLDSAKSGQWRKIQSVLDI